MTLPAKRRPIEVERMIEEEKEKQKCDHISNLTARINLKHCFMEQMISWCSQLSPREKSALTKKRVIRHATHVAHRLCFPYANLPNNWLRTLYYEHGIRFKFPKRCRSKNEWNPLTMIAIGSESKLSASTSKMATEKICSEPESECASPSKIFDLTNEPPPLNWLEAYLNETHTPRLLKVYRDPKDDVMVLYYDYEPNIKPDGGLSAATMSQPIHDRDGIFRHPNQFKSWF